LSPFCLREVTQSPRGPRRVPLAHDVSDLTQRDHPRREPLPTGTCWRSRIGRRKGPRPRVAQLRAASGDVTYLLGLRSYSGSTTPPHVHDARGVRQNSVLNGRPRRGSTGSLPRASTPKTHSWTRRSGSPRTNRSSASTPSANSRTARDRLWDSPLSFRRSMFPGAVYSDAEDHAQRERRSEERSPHPGGAWRRPEPADRAVGATGPRPLRGESLWPSGASRLCSGRVRVAMVAPPPAVAGRHRPAPLRLLFRGRARVALLQFACRSAPRRGSPGGRTSSKPLADSSVGGGI
jgi:hypothetical protein